MDLLYNPLKTRPIQTGREMSMEPYPNRQFGFIDDSDRQSGSGSVPTRTWTWSDGPDPSLTLDLTTDCQSRTVRAWSGPVHTCLQFWHCFIVKYCWKYDSSSHLITTHLWIPTLGEIMSVLSVYSVPSRYISPIKWPIQWEIYCNSGHSAGLIHTSPVQSSPGTTELGIGLIPVQNILGLDWIGLGRTRSALVHCWTGGIIGLSFHRTCLPIYHLQIDSLEIDCIQIGCLQFDCLQIDCLQIDCFQIDCFQIDCFKIDCLQIDCLQIDCFKIDCLQIDCLQIDCLQMNCLQIDCLQIDNLQMNCLLIYCLQIDSIQINCLQITCLPVLLQSCLIMASKRISQYTQLRVRSAFQSTLDLHLQVQLSLLDLSLQLLLRTYSIPASMCIFDSTWSQSPGASPNTLDHCLQVHLAEAMAGV